METRNSNIFIYDLLSILNNCFSQINAKIYKMVNEYAIQNIFS